MKVSSHQPAFLPWAGYWHKIAATDVCIIPTGVQWAKDGYLNRCEHNGGWLTIPTDARDTSAICTVKLVDDRMIGKAAKAMDQIAGAYKHRLAPLREVLLESRRGDLIWSMNTRLILRIAHILGVETKFEATTMIGDAGSKTGRLYQRIKAVVPSATAYYAGAGSKDYLHSAGMRGLALHRQVTLHQEPVPSIMQLIAQHDDPLAYINSLFSWERVS